MLRRVKFPRQNEFARLIHWGDDAPKMRQRRIVCETTEHLRHANLVGRGTFRSPVPGSKRVFESVFHRTCLDHTIDVRIRD